MKSKQKKEGKRKATSHHTNESESDSEDEELLQAAAAWAQKEEGTQPLHAAVEGGSQESPPEPGKGTRDNWSLHLTQLSYKATDFDIRHTFVKHGCSVMSVRIVYDYDEKGTKKSRGVAFVDMADKESYEAALKLHNTILLGRKINVRPTKTKNELADIVERRKILVKEKIRQHKEEKDSKGSVTGNETSKDSAQKEGRKGSKTKSKAVKRPRDDETKRPKKSAESKKPKTSAPDTDTKIPAKKKQPSMTKTPSIALDTVEAPDSHKKSRRDGEGARSDEVRPSKKKTEASPSTAGGGLSKEAKKESSPSPSKTTSSSKVASQASDAAQVGAKLSKKQRNRRAAIINQRNRRR